MGHCNDIHAVGIPAKAQTRQRNCSRIEPIAYEVALFVSLEDFPLERWYKHVEVLNLAY